MRLRFRPKRAADFQEMPFWIFRVNDESKESLTKNDRPKKEKNNEKQRETKLDFRA